MPELYSTVLSLICSYALITAFPAAWHSVHVSTLGWPTYSLGFGWFVWAWQVSSDWWHAQHVHGCLHNTCVLANCAKYFATESSAPAGLLVPAQGQALLPSAQPATSLCFGPHA